MSLLLASVRRRWRAARGSPRPARRRARRWAGRDAVEGAAVVVEPDLAEARASGPGRRGSRRWRRRRGAGSPERRPGAKKKFGMNFTISAMLTCTVPSSFGSAADVARGLLEVHVLLEALGGDHVPQEVDHAPRPGSSPSSSPSGCRAGSGGPRARRSACSRRRAARRASSRPGGIGVDEHAAARAGSR